MPTIVSDVPGWRQIRQALAGSIGLVPTMGALHEGHLTLCRRALAENDHVVVSIFVNPSQFNEAADFDAYQRTLETDAAQLEKIGVPYIFHPTAEEIYADNYEVRVQETVISRDLEGEFRPGHFEGVLTVVLKLLNIVGPARAYFGEKDYQQFLLIEKMAQALFVPTEIIRCETSRMENGLALSSRNARLSADQQVAAGLLSTLLQSTLTDAEIIEKLTEAGFKPEYVVSKWGRRLAAAWLGDVRLIDNVTLNTEKEESRHAALS